MARKGIGTAAEPDPANGGTFSELLNWHMAHGTRPEGQPGHDGKAWQVKELAFACSTSERAVTGWRSGRAVPDNHIETLFRALFGDAPIFDAYRQNFRRAFNLARSAANRRTEASAEPAAASSPPIQPAEKTVRQENRDAIFISAVTNEFGQVRDRIAGDLRLRGFEVRVQHDFDLRDMTVLEKLSGYIAECGRVICLLGRRSGKFPGAPPPGPLRGILPAGMDRASYTQWEHLLAHHHGCETLRFIAAATCPRDRERDEPEDETDCQRRFLETQIYRRDMDYREFSTPEDLRLAIVNLPWVLAGAPGRQRDRRPDGPMVATVPADDPRVIKIVKAIGRVLLRSVIAVNVLIAAAEAQQEPASSSVLPARAGDAGEPAEQLAGFLVRVPFEAATACLNRALGELAEREETNARNVIVDVGRHLIPWLLVEREVDPVLAGQLRCREVPDIVRDLPAGVRNFAEIIVAGLDGRAVAFSDATEPRPFPDPTFGLGVLPESGIADSGLANLRKELAARLQLENADRLSPETLDKAIKARQKFIYDKTGCRYFWALMVPHHPRDAERARALMQSASEHYPALMVIELKEEFYVDNIILLDDIRHLIGLAES